MTVNTLQAQASVQELEDELTSLAQAIFTEKDKASNVESREQQLELMNECCQRMASDTT